MAIKPFDSPAKEKDYMKLLTSTTLGDDHPNRFQGGSNGRRRQSRSLDAADLILSSNSSVPLTKLERIVSGEETVDPSSIRRERFRSQFLTDIGDENVPTAPECGELQITSVSLPNLPPNFDSKKQGLYLSPNPQPRRRTISSPEFGTVEEVERVKDWAKSFLWSDPRFLILQAFNEIYQEGMITIAKNDLRLSFRQKSSFSVWRPTSPDAIKRMMLGKAAGKGLEIKGKSARSGDISGYVPFVQIHSSEQHKLEIRTLCKGSRVRVFYECCDARDEAFRILTKVSQEMVAKVKAIREESGDECVFDRRFSRWEMENPEISLIDTYNPKFFGIEMPERLLWEAYIMRQDINRAPGSNRDIGRDSEPAFQDANFESIRNSERVVVLQLACVKDPLCPCSLLMAYEEYGKVMPVVSDFDAFLVGTRGVKYDEPLPPYQVQMLQWCVSQIENVLDDHFTAESWTGLWLEVLKQESLKDAYKKNKAKLPPLGFGDPKSYKMMEKVITRLSCNGAVRHGAECFNYCFPQALDDKFLVISDDTWESDNSAVWKYVNATELKDILCKKIDEGYTFPLHPKWILCDKGWKKVYDKLMQSQRPHVQDSLNVWFPRESGLRERIEEIHRKHKDGLKGKLGDSVEDATEAADLAKIHLKRYCALKRAKLKLRSVLLWRKPEKKKSRPIPWLYAVPTYIISVSIVRCSIALFLQSPNIRY